MFGLGATLMDDEFGSLREAPRVLQRERTAPSFEEFKQPIGGLKVFVE
jgi:hypothetical protein